MSLRRLIETVAEKNASSMTGTVASAFYQLYDSTAGWVWACDVDTGQEQTIEDINGDPVTTTVMVGVPIATNNRDILYAQEGWPVTLQKMAGNKWSIVGLSKSKIGTNVYIFVTFDQGYGSTTRTITLGKYTRKLTYEELSVYGMYGDIPYGAIGRFNKSDDSFVELVSGV
jgi:hypothetical protein